MNSEANKKYVSKLFDDWFVPALQAFVRVPNLTPSVDPEYMTNGLYQKCAEVMDQELDKLEVQGLTKHVVTVENSPPLYVYEVAPNMGSKKNVMLYGHLDKQPWGEGWNTSPTDPVVKDGKMFGRGTSDDGYAPFLLMMCVKACQAQGVSHPRIVMTIEAEEESGSAHLVELVKKAKEIIGDIDAMFCMDAGALDYDSMWVTSSLRGICCVDLNVECSIDGMHSGVVGGLVPETFAIVRELLDRVDCSATGKVKLPGVTSYKPSAAKLEEAKFAVSVLGDSLYNTYAVQEGATYLNAGNLEAQYLASVWESNLAVTGASGLPEINTAGNVIRPHTAVRLSLRLPPTADCEEAYTELTKTLTENPPYNAKITTTRVAAGNGFCVKPYSAWMEKSLNSCKPYFDNRPIAQYGLGGSIPFLSTLSKMYPNTEVIPLGALGPGCNAHGPNEMIVLDYTKRLACAFANVLNVASQ